MGDVNALDKVRCTPLHYCRSPAIASLLIASGADFHAKHDFGHEPWFRAKNLEIAEVFYEHGFPMWEKFARRKAFLTALDDLTQSEDLKKLMAQFCNFKVMAEFCNFKKLVY